MKVSNTSQNGPSVVIKQMLKTDVNKLNSTQQKLLNEFENSELQAKSSVQKLGEDLKKIVVDEAVSFNNNIAASNLKSEEQKKAKDIFSQMILKRLEVLSDKIFEDLKKSEGYLFNAMLSESIIDILEIIQEFKAKIDKYLPIPSEEILKLAAPALVVLIGASAPGLAIVLKTTGIVDKTLDFLETKNLNKTIENLRSGLATFNEEKSFAVINKTSKLCQQIESSPKTISKLGVSPDKLEMVVKGVTTTPEVKTFVKEIAAYVEKTLPNTDKEVITTLQAIKKSTLDALKANEAPKELITKISKQIDASFVKAREELKPTLNPKANVFDKIKAQTRGAELILNYSKDITKIIQADLPNKKDIATKVTNVLTKEVKNRMQGNLGKVVQQMKDPKVKNFAMQALGAGHANLIDVEKGASLGTNRGEIGRSRP